MKQKGLGRGLDALLAGNDASGKEQQRMLPVTDIRPGKYRYRATTRSVSRSSPASAAGGPRRSPE